MKQPSQYIFKTEKEKTITIITNVVKMLSNRIYVDKNGKKNKLMDYAKTMEMLSDGHSIAVPDDNVFELLANDGTIYMVKIVYHVITSITSVSKYPDINDFINESVEKKKILVISGKSQGDKIGDSSVLISTNTQIFEEHKLLVDIISHVLQPQYELLTQQEATDVMNEYGFESKHMKTMSPKDPVAQYFGLKKGDIIKIIRPSPTSGTAVDYRRIGF